MSWIRLWYRRWLSSFRQFLLRPNVFVRPSPHSLSVREQYTENVQKTRSNHVSNQPKSIHDQLIETAHRYKQSPIETRFGQRWSSSTKGLAQGTRVNTLKVYQQGESARDIHWGRSLGRKQLFVRERSMIQQSGLLISLELHPEMLHSDLQKWTRALVLIVAIGASQLSHGGALYIQFHQDHHHGAVHHIRSITELIQILSHSSSLTFDDQITYKQKSNSNIPHLVLGDGYSQDHSHLHHQNYMTWQPMIYCLLRQKNEHTPPLDQWIYDPRGQSMPRTISSSELAAYRKDIEQSERALQALLNQRDAELLVLSADQPLTDQLKCISDQIKRMIS